MGAWQLFTRPSFEPRKWNSSPLGCRAGPLYDASGDPVYIAEPVPALSPSAPTTADAVTTVPTGSRADVQGLWHGV